MQNDEGLTETVVEIIQRLKGDREITSEVLYDAYLQARVEEYKKLFRGRCERLAGFGLIRGTLP